MRLLRGASLYCVICFPLLTVKPLVCEFNLYCLITVVEDTTILIEGKAREILLHKYLELHLQKHLDNQSSYFQRGYSTGKPRRRYSNRISKSEWRSRRLAKQTCSKQPSKPNKFDLQPLGEAAVQRTIRQLVADLSKYGRYGKNAEMETRRDLDGKPPRPKSGSCSGKSRHRFASQQVVTSSSSRSQSDFSSDESSSKRSPVIFGFRLADSLPSESFSVQSETITWESSSNKLLVTM